VDIALSDPKQLFFANMEEMRTSSCEKYQNYEKSPDFKQLWSTSARKYAEGCNVAPPRLSYPPL
jgi:hypothetical protein